MYIAQVNYQDLLGGAERIAYEIHKGLQQEGCHSDLYVGRKKTDHPAIIEISPDTGNPAYLQWLINLAKKLEAVEKTSITHYSSKLLRAVAKPAVFRRWWRGEEEFDFVKTRLLLDKNGRIPDIMHLHNLHGGYFDLRLLPQLCQQQPVNITLHDEWMYTGHCGYASGCHRWQTGCGECPDLASYPAIRVDNTSNNLQVKKQIYSHSRFYLTTPSKWLLERAKNSAIAEAIINYKVIHNGVDTDIFKRVDHDDIRQKLSIPAGAFVGLFIANHFQSSKAKDYPTVLDAMRRLAENNRQKYFVLIAIGEAMGTRHIDNLKIRTLPYLDDQIELATYYQAADVYLHAAFTEVWGLTVTEAMACGIPVVATETGGIPEQVRSLAGHGVTVADGHSLENATGILVEQGNSRQMYQAVSALLEDLPVRNQLGDNAVRLVNENFTIKSMFRQYMDWYQVIMEEAAQRS